MNRSVLHILAPGDPRTPGEDALVLVDRQPCPAAEADRLADRIVTGPGIERVDGAYSLRSEDAAPKRIPGHVLFFAVDDTHVNTFMRIAPHCESYTFVVQFSLDLNARARLLELGIPYRPHNPFMPEFQHASAALLGSDNGPEARLFVQHCRRNGIPTVCLQEAVNIDFAAGDTRMRWPDTACVGGLQSLRYLQRQVAFLTGNPRYDDLSPKPLPEMPYLLINCNFTFGFGVEWSRAWLDEVIATADSLGFEYRITRHPRDETDITSIEHILPSNAFVVHEHLAGCWAIVSRDSSLPYEAILLDRHAVYYNPFQEPERCLREDDSGFIHKCASPAELRDTLSELRQRPTPGIQKDLPPSLQALYTANDGASHARVAAALHSVVEHRDLYRTEDARREPYLTAWLRVIGRNLLGTRLRRITWLRNAYRKIKRGAVS